MKKVSVILLFIVIANIASSQKKDSSIQKGQEDIKKYVEDKMNSQEKQLLNETIKQYQETNDRINTHITFLSLIATIFGTIIAVGGILIGFESIKSSKRRNEAIKTLEEAKRYVEEKKTQFDGELTQKKADVEKEYASLVALLKEQLLKDINEQTSNFEKITAKKTEEIESYSIKQENEVVIENLTRRLKFFENVGIPDDAEILLSKAKLLGEKNMHSESIEILEKIISKDPNNRSAHWSLGWEYSKLGKNEKAIEHYSKTIELNSSDSTAYNNLGVAQQALEKYYDASKSYTKAIELDFKRKLYYTNKAKVLKKLNSNPEAMDIWRKNVDLFPDDLDSYKELIRELNEEEKYDESLLVYDKAVSAFPDKSQELNGLKVTLLYRIKRYDEAMPILNSLIEIGYQAEECYRMLSNIFEERDNENEALNVLEKGLTLNARNEKLIQRKLELILKKNPEEAYRYVQEIGKEFKSERILHMGGRVFSKSNDFEKSNSLYKQALQIISSKLGDGKEGDILNYLEGLIVIGEYKEAKNFIAANQKKIINSTYNNVLNFLELSMKVLGKEINITKDEFLNFNKLKKDGKVSWNFDDVEYVLLRNLDTGISQMFTTLASYVNDEISKEDFERKINLI